MRSLEARIERLSAAVPEAGCWLWLGATTPRGYGKITIRTGVSEYAHRLSWMLSNGEIPSGTYVCHKCDTPSCVNPAHLFLGTPSDNNRDMVSKGRHTFGSKVNTAKLAEPQVAEIRKAAGTCKKLAARFGVSASTINFIKTGQRWKHLSSAAKP